MTSFQVKISWKMMGKRENEKLSFRFVSTRRVTENSKKVAKKFKKLKNTIMASFQAKLGGEGRERARVKIKVSFCSYPTRYRKIQKKKPKNSKNSKVPLWLHFNLK